MTEQDRLVQEARDTIKATAAGYAQLRATEQRLLDRIEAATRRIELLKSLRAMGDPEVMELQDARDEDIEVLSLMLGYSKSGLSGWDKDLRGVNK